MNLISLVALILLSGAILVVAHNQITSDIQTKGNEFCVANGWEGYIRNGTAFFDESGVCWRFSRIENKIYYSEGVKLLGNNLTWGSERYEWR